MLADIGGKPLVVRTWARALRAGFARVVVATDAVEIAHAVEAHGGEVVMTGDCPNGTARVAEAWTRLAAAGARADVVVNVQADEPLVAPASLAAVAAGIGTADVATGVAPLLDPHDPSRVKAVVGALGQALYFSRLPVPRGGPYLLHVGVYAFRPEALLRAVALPPHPLELAEGLEQLRWLAHGLRVATVPLPEAEGGVDTAGDLERVRARFVAGDARGS